MTSMNLKSLVLVAVMGAFIFGEPAYPGKDRDGGFEYENSREILKRASSELAEALENADAALFPPFAPGWSQKRLAELIRTVRHSHELVTVGTNPMDGRERRVFDYEFILDEKGNPLPGQGYLAALRPYFEQFKHIPVFTSESSVVEEAIREVKRRLLHEASHLVWEYNERKSLEISVELLAVLAPLSTDRNRLPLTAEVATSADPFLALTGYELFSSRNQYSAEGHPLVRSRADRICRYYGFHRAVDFPVSWFEHPKQLKYVDDGLEPKSFVAESFHEMTYYRYPRFARKPIMIPEAEFDESNPAHRAVVTKIWKLGMFSKVTCLRDPQAD